MARSQGKPLYGGNEVDRAIPACELRTAGDRVHGRRPEGVYAAVYRQSSPADCRGRFRTDRIRLPRKPDVSEADRPRKEIDRFVYYLARARSPHHGRVARVAAPSPWPPNPIPAA